ncbi:hypothetical protein TrCOL_g7436 [Triparma columacea]|uniref:DNA topoisomerase (ATP-hydrolyzing) n=1 Tax=Triparma columacea TaxID=722753 RepID=A0A9W7LGC8_9STRA|nr:hypothetical protein TrCOL_g7436 [Triparma columacea]
MATARVEVLKRIETLVGSIVTSLNSFNKDSKGYVPFLSSANLMEGGREVDEESFQGMDGLQGEFQYSNDDDDDDSDDDSDVDETTSESSDDRGSIDRDSESGERQLRAVNDGAHPSFSKKMTPTSSKSFANVVLVLDYVHALLTAGKTTTIRELYYHYVTHFKSQTECNTAIHDAARLLDVERGCLGLFASSKGWIAGSISFSNCPGAANSIPPLSAQGRPITSSWLTPSGPTILPKPYSKSLVPVTSAPLDPSRTFFHSDAKCIIVIEKEGIYTRLVEDRFFDVCPCILVTGKGYPDLATRACVSTLSSALDIPVLGVCDCNPHGLGVLASYRRGNARNVRDGGAYESDVKWLGLRPTQVLEMRRKGELPESVFQRATERDKSRAKGMLKDEFAGGNEGIKEEVDIMIEEGWKVELEALAWKGVDYLSGTWLPGLVLGGDYL